MLSNDKSFRIVQAEKSTSSLLVYVRQEIILYLNDKTFNTFCVLSVAYVKVYKYDTI